MKMKLAATLIACGLSLSAQRLPPEHQSKLKLVNPPAGLRCPDGYRWSSAHTLKLTIPPAFGDDQCHSIWNDRNIVPLVKDDGFARVEELLQPLTEYPIYRQTPIGVTIPERSTCVVAMVRESGEFDFNASVPCANKDQSAEKTKAVEDAARKVSEAHTNFIECKTDCRLLKLYRDVALEELTKAVRATWTIFQVN